MTISRRRFIIGAAGAALGLPLAAVGYARFIEPRWLSLDHRDIFLGGGAARAAALKRPAQSGASAVSPAADSSSLNSPQAPPFNSPPQAGGTHGGRHFRVLHISDIHESDLVPASFIAEGFAAGLAFAPEAIFLTGDFVTDELHNPRAYKRALQTLSAAAPTFACLGNHDGGWRWAHYQDTRIIADFLGDAGVEVLTDEVRLIPIGGGANIALYGLSDLWVSRRRGTLADNIARAFAPIAGGGAARVTTIKQSPRRDADINQAEAGGDGDIRQADDIVARIVLGHNPDIKDAIIGEEWDILLAGHTHGGQVRYPPFFNTPHGSVRDRRFLRGLHDWEGRQLYVNQGLGNIYGVRFACRPQVAVLDFHF